MPGGSASKPFQNLENQQLDELGGFSKCLAYEKIAVSSVAIKALTVPKNTRFALVVVMADPSITDPVAASNLIYIREDGVAPVTGASPGGDGLPIGDLGIYEVKGISNLKNFKMVAIRPGETHSVRIQYFG